MNVRRRQFRGFTLLELILVMVVVCVALALAAPSLRNTGKGMQIEDATAQLVALTEWARSAAITSGNVHRINIDRGENTYWLTMQSGEQFVELGEEIGQVFDMPRDSTLILSRGDGSAVDYVEFFPSGRSDPGTLTITDQARRETRIVSESATEPFHVVDDEREQGS